MGDASDNSNAPDSDVIVIGAGLSGIYSLHLLRSLFPSDRVKLLEGGTSVGGTWYWNRYPGARFDSESISYGYSFSEEILNEWAWTEQFAPAYETRAYCEFVVEKLGLRENMVFETQIDRLVWVEEMRYWRLYARDGRTFTTRWLITAMGPLNAPTMPNIPGLEDFKGESFHTARWPDGVSLKGKRVGIIGVGATGIQTITEIYKEVEHLTVFQRTPNWTGPLRNAKISKEEMLTIRDRYPAIFEQCRNSSALFLHTTDMRSTWDVTEEERIQHWEYQYSLPGFGKWVGNFRDVYSDRAANKLYSDWVAEKIRQRVDDPETAEKLIPKCHGFGTRRVPLESGFYEAFNQPHVDLVDVRDEADPIERVNEKGIKTRTRQFEFDVIIYATGFDAVTGAFTNIDFEGVGGEKMADQWLGGPRTFLGLFVRGFPNMGMVMGPHQMFGNIPRSIEYAAEYLTDFLRYCLKNGYTRVEATEESVEMWTKHVYQTAEGMLSNEVDSWMTGVNKNLKHKQKRIVARYNGPVQGFRKRCEDVRDNDYQGLKKA
jgi:cation diffusion facilitator CzcD-associated flavoprotein CzcO